MQPNSTKQTAISPTWDDDGELIDTPRFKDWHRHTRLLFTGMLLVALLTLVAAKAQIQLPWLATTFLQLSPPLYFLLPMWHLHHRMSKLGYPRLSFTANSYFSIKTGFLYRRLPVYTIFRQHGGYPNTVTGLIKYLLDTEKNGMIPVNVVTADPPDTSTGQRWREWDLGRSPGIKAVNWQAILTLGIIFVIVQLPVMYLLVTSAGRVSGIMLAPTLTPLLMMIPVLWAKSQMVANGYPSPTFGGAMRLFFYLGFRASKIPNYGDFCMVPGYRNSINGLIDFMRDMRRRSADGGG